MKVVQLVSSIENESSGPSHSVPGLCAGLSKAGCDVELQCLFGIPSHLKKAPFSIIAHKCSSHLKVCYSSAMRSSLSRTRADIIHNNGMWQFPNVYCLEAAEKTGAKLVFAPRGCLAVAAKTRSRLRKAIFGAIWQNRVLEKSNMFHATSQKEYAEIRSSGYRQPVAIVPVGLDLPPFKRRLEDAEPRILAFFGRLHEIKGVDKLLYAWRLVHARMPNWSVKIAGPDCGSLARLKSMVAEFNLPRVEFVGELNGQAKYDFLSSVDLYALPTKTENFGVTIAEALACGTPVITTKGAPWSGLEENKCGWWIDNSVEALANAIDEASVLPPLTLLEMGERGRCWMERDFSWNGIGLRMKSAYEWLLGRGDKPDCVVTE